MRKKIKMFFDLMKILVAWVYLKIFERGLFKENIWLIREKKNEARDNGYHFFCYLKEKQPQINAYYVITPDSADLHKVLKYGNIIEADSFKHCVYYLAAKNNISSQPFGAYPYHFSSKVLLFLKRFCHPNQKVIFLQHGVIKDELSPDYLYKKCNINYFVCSAEREYEFVKKKYQYPDEAIGCVGLARFDKLHECSTEERIILIMPTWRKWLSCMSDLNVPTQKEIDSFEQSEFYKEYADVLSDNEIISLLREHQYKIIFYLHYKIQGYTKLFDKFENDIIKIAYKENYDVQTLLKSSKVLVTDYSSVYFDFAYMNKPILYYQFDKIKFNQSHYSKGYFSYENDGFGPCCKGRRELKEKLKSLIEDSCKQPEKYRQRVDKFFELHDNNNCERIFNAIYNLK